MNPEGVRFELSDLIPDNDHKPPRRSLGSRTGGATLGQPALRGFFIAALTPNPTRALGGRRGSRTPRPTVLSYHDRQVYRGLVPRYPKHRRLRTLHTSSTQSDCVDLRRVYAQAAGLGNGTSSRHHNVSPLAGPRWQYPRPECPRVRFVTLPSSLSPIYIVQLLNLNRN